MPKSNKSKTSVEKKSKVRSPQPDSRSASPLPRPIESPPAGAVPLAKSPFELPGQSREERKSPPRKTPVVSNPTPAKEPPAQFRMTSPEEVKEEELQGAFITGKGIASPPPRVHQTQIAQAPLPKDVSKEWKIKEILIPAGMPAKLVQVPDPNYEGFRVSDMADRLKFTEPTPVIVLIGAAGQRAGKTMAGVVRAASRIDAVIIDSGIASGIEKFAMRKNVPLIGVCPQSEIVFPKLNPTSHPDNELSNGHTHFVLLGNEKNKMNWGDEIKVKLELAQRIAKGRPKYGSHRGCRVLALFFGDNEETADELALVGKYNWPVLIVAGSDTASQIFSERTGRDPEEDLEEDEGSRAASKQMSRPKGVLKAEFKMAVEQCKRIQVCRNSSEEVAASAHLLLTVDI